MILSLTIFKVNNKFAELGTFAMPIDNVTRISNHIEKVEEFISSEPDPIESAKLMVMMNMMYEQKDMAEMIVEHKTTFTSQIAELTKKSVEHDKVVVQVKVVLSLLLLTSGGLYNLTSKYIDIIDMLRIDQQMLVKDIRTLKESVDLK